MTHSTALPDDAAHPPPIGRSVPPQLSNASIDSSPPVASLPSSRATPEGRGRCSAAEKLDSSQIFLLLSWSRVPEQNGRILDRSVNEFGKARHSECRGPCAIASRGGQEPLSDDASRDRSGGTGHPRRGVSSPWPAPTAAGSVRPVRRRATHSLLNQEIGDSNPAKVCQPVPQSANRRGEPNSARAPEMWQPSANPCNDPRWAPRPSEPNESRAHGVSRVPTPPPRTPRPVS
jgi:hypothetical protein